MKKEIEVKKDFSDVIDEEKRHKEILEEQKKFNKKKLEQEKKFHKESLKVLKEVESEKGSSYSFWNKISNLLMMVLIVANIFLIYVSYQGMLDNRLLVNRTIETLSPIEASLKIEPITEGRDLFFQKYDLSHVLRGSDNKTTSRARIKVKIINYGQIGSGPINLHIRSDWAHKTSLHVPNIEKSDQETILLFIWYKECFYEDDIEDCVLENLTNGTQTLILETECDGCNPKTQKTEIRICIWEKEEAECINLWNL